MHPNSPPADRAASHDSETPYAGLTPEAVLDALDAVGLRGDGRLIQLNSYENRVFQVFLEDGTVVVPKFYRPGRWSDEQILEEHAFAAELADAEVPVVPPMRLADQGTLARHEVDGQTYRFSVSPRRSGRPPELEDLNTMEWIGRFIGRIHCVGATRPFAHRLSLDVKTYGQGPRDWLLASQLIPLDAESDWRQAADAALAMAQACVTQVGPVTSLRLHGDCHTGNVLWTEAGPHFVDLDDALNGPAVQDFWMLLAGEREVSQQQLAALIAGYEDFREFDWRELRLIEVLRTLRIIHYSGWIARRWNDPAFPAAFPWFGDRGYWNAQATMLREQVRAMEQAMSGPGS